MYRNNKIRKSIPSKAYREPLEHVQKFLYMIVFASSKYKSNTRILKALQYIDLLLNDIERANISTIEYWKKKRREQ